MKLALLALLAVVGLCQAEGEVANSTRAALLAQEALVLENTNQELSSKLWLESAALGNETAQFVVGVMHFWGLHGLPKDERKAVLHFYFSALGGHVPAQMALAYRYSRGDDVAANCKTASMYGELASNQLVDGFLQEKMVEPAFTANRVLAPDETKVDAKYSDEDLVEYYLNLASKGDKTAMGALGKIYFYGAREVDRDLARSHKLLSMAASEGDIPATASLAHLLLMGAGANVPVDALGAFGNFSKAALAGNHAALNGLGYMYLIGYEGVVHRDVKMAIQSFTKATEGNGQVPEAYYNLGAIHASGLEPHVARDFVKAFRFFTLAAQKGSVLALHKLAHMSLHGLGTAKSCKVAVQYFKAVSERMRFAMLGKHEFAKAFANAERHHPQLAYEQYLRLAEMGYELAELHAVLDAFKIAHPPLFAAPDAFRLYERAAEQGNTRARLRVGDFWYYGESDYQEAALQYRIASEGSNAQAHFNLGYQHHHGLGLVKDLHLAKRYYDMAYEASPDSKLAVSISLCLLWWENAQKAWMGENLVTSSVHPQEPQQQQVAVATGEASVGWGEFQPQAWLNYATQVSLDFVLIVVLLVAFFGVGLYRDRRLARRRAVAPAVAAAA
ncbi:hypothetical protein BASA81_001518 [Batrachochytrium salamandrivorans]|nr:hypothetical protein BASA81_001518 [Batrachochytrium salamandrivorans]